MSRLTVFAESKFPTDDHFVVNVAAMTEIRPIGVVCVMVPKSHSDPHAVAEVVAVRYLISRLKQFKRSTGRSHEIVVSKGAIKKMARFASQKTELYEYGYPLITRYAEARITVSKDFKWFDRYAEARGHQALVPVIDASDYYGHETISLPVLGEVGITRHAIEQYAQYCDTVNLSSAWKNLVRRLRSNLQKFDIPPKVLSHKLRKYGAAPEIWKNPDHPLHYIFENRCGTKVLVTVFMRDSAADMKVFRPAYENA